MFQIRLNTRNNLEELKKKKSRIITTLPELMRACGRQIAVSCAISTAPYGVGQGARNAGERAVQRDIAKVYVPIGKVFKSFPNTKWGDSFWAAVSRRNYAQAQNIMDAYNPVYRRIPIRVFDGGAAHQSIHKSRGKVPNNQKPVMVTQSDRRLVTYIKQEVNHVGEAKGGWAACANLLGGMRGLPQWVTRHAGNLSGGTKIEQFNGPKWSLTIRNEVSYAAQALSASEKQVAINVGLQRFLRGQIAAIMNGRASTRD